MALLPSGYVISTRGNSNVPVERIGGTAIGISSATSTGVGNPLTQAFTCKDMATVHGRVTAIRKTGQNSVFNATYALSSTGTFAYEMSDWMVMRLGTTINGTASNVLKFASAAQRLRRSLRQKSWGARTSTYFRLNRLVWVGTGRRSPWSVAMSGLNDTFRSTTNNGTDSSDEAIYATFMSVPGELVYMEGKRNPTTDEYEAVTL